MVRQKVIAGNWKMYKTNQQATAYLRELMPLVSQASHSIYLAVPFTAIESSVQETEGTNIVIGAQNMNDATEGAYTGEIAGAMLVSVGAKFVLLGHSERRTIFHEDDQFINKKVLRALESNLQPILCVGETLAQREANQTSDVLESQLKNCLEGVSPEQLAKMIIAYEPIWAIGTGETATPEQAEEAHRTLREIIGQHWSQEASEQITLIYGGSVKPANAPQLMERPDIDGLLVGAASLKTDSFSQIVNYQPMVEETQKEEPETEQVQKEEPPKEEAQKEESEIEQVLEEEPLEEEIQQEIQKEEIKELEE